PEGGTTAPASRSPAALRSRLGGRWRSLRLAPALLDDVVDALLSERDDLPRIEAHACRVSLGDDEARSLVPGLHGEGGVGELQRDRQGLLLWRQGSLAGSGLGDQYVADRPLRGAEVVVGGHHCSPFFSRCCRYHAARRAIQESSMRAWPSAWASAASPGV